MHRFYHLQREDGQRSLVENFFAPLLKEELLAGLLLPKMTSLGSTIHALIKNPEALEGVYPLTPLMLSSGAKAVSSISFKGLEGRIGALLRPCEIRSLVELVKLKQVQRDKILIIGHDCLGTLEIDDYKTLYKQRGEDLFSMYYQGLLDGELEGMNLREACLYCQVPSSQGADIHICSIGSTEGSLYLEAMTSQGEEVLEELGLKEVEPPSKREDSLALLREKREEDSLREKELFKEKIEDFNGFLENFAFCLGCHNCRLVCPICYCRECIFTTLVFEHQGDTYVKWARRKGAIRIPSDIALFHLTRLNHMALSCVGCGLCESACPVGVPLLKIFKYFGEEAQDLFSYVPGVDVEVPIPLTTFKEDELEPR